MKDETAVVCLGALAHPMRLALFRALVEVGPDGSTPGVLAQRLGLPAPTLSFHLKELLRAALVSQQRAGRHLVYRADFARIRALLAHLTEHCCGGVPCGVAAPRMPIEEAA
jgi:DNA-binding transcriptional ArsR family regulator